MSAPAAFRAKFASFCALNDLEPGDEALFLAMGQASAFGQTRNGLAFSSMESQFGSLLKGRTFPCPAAWEAKRMLENAAADSNPVQPRIFEGSQESLTKLVHMLRPIEEKVMGFLQFSSGTRAKTISRLRNSQVKLQEGATLLQRRWSKVQHKRSTRATLTYKVAWSMEAPEDVRLWLAEQSEKYGPDELIFSARFQTKSGASAAMTKALRKSSGDDNITSYAFRDFMEEKLTSLGLDENQVELLMEHTAETGRASYKKDPITRAQAVTAKKMQATKKAATATAKKTLTTKKIATKKGK